MFYHILTFNDFILNKLNTSGNTQEKGLALTLTTLKQSKQSQGTLLC